MEAIRKMYGTKKPFTKGSFNFSYVDKDGEKISVQIPFSKGRLNPNFLPGRFVTSDPLLQEAIETSKNYNKMYVFMRQMPIVRPTNIVEGAPATTATMMGKTHFHGVHQQEPSEEVIVLNKPTGNPSFDGHETIKAVDEPVKENALPNGFTVPAEGLSDVTSGVRARQWLTKNLPWIKAGKLTNNTVILEVSKQYNIEFPNWNP